MKKPIQTRISIAGKLFLVVLAIVVGMAHSVSAEPVPPARPGNEARAEKVTSTPSGQNPTRTLAAEVKSWLRTQWRVIKKYWIGVPNPPKSQSVQTAAVPTAPGPAVPGPTAQRAPQSPAQSPAQSAAQSPAAATPVAVNADEVPRLSIQKEESFGRDRYSLDDRLQRALDDRLINSRVSPELLSQGALKQLIGSRRGEAGPPEKVAEFSLGAKGTLSRAAIDSIKFSPQAEAALKLSKVEPLTADELRFLSGLLLYQRGGQCPTAIGLFHRLSKAKGWGAEANYFLAMCSKQLSLRTDFYERATEILETQDVHYSRKILREVGTDVPYEIETRFGGALLKVAANSKIIEGLDPETAANLAYNAASFAIASENYKVAQIWAGKVPESHPNYLKARFLLALAEYRAGSKETALRIQEQIVNDPKTDKTKSEFQAIVALNAARMQFQEKNFRAAYENFHKVYKDHPLWLQSLTELGWSQLMNGDYEGAIGNMYSIHSPFFAGVYKPESFVFRTVGYLNLCQYGDAYRTLSILERDYRPYLQRMADYIEHAKSQPAHYQTVRNFLTAPKGTKEVDGLPLPVIREMARHRDFINLQKSLNRQIDEKPNYARMNNEVEANLQRAQAAVSETRRQVEVLRKKLAQATAPAGNQAAAKARIDAELDLAFAKLNDQFFHVDLYTEAKAGVDDYRRDVIAGVDRRIADLRVRIETALGARLQKMKVELARMLDNNELLRYEVFAGSGENIRYQVAGGEVGNRVPASVLPKAKSLQWDFDGEYWEDEIGHYRSSLKNNCPERQTTQASLGGGMK